MKNQFSYSGHFLVIISIFFSGMVSACDEGRTPTSTPYEHPERTLDLEDAQWPISGDREPNSDISYAQYGPRSLPGGYDFHAGIDLPASTGTDIYPILPGEVVQMAEWDGQSTGAGNAITIKHSDSLASSYLHLHTIEVEKGMRVGLDDVVGTVGSTGSSYAHLHLGYFVELPDPDTRDERYSRNPLEILPHNAPGQIPYTFTENGEVVLDMPLQSMTANSIELIGEGESRKADYYDIVARGWTPRKDPVQFGIRFDAARRSADHMRFDLTVKPENRAFQPERIIVKDFNGRVLLDATR